jgi:hypothetical protein
VDVPPIGFRCAVSGSTPPPAPAVAAATGAPTVAPGPAGACRSDAQFVADVTVPDGTRFDAGQAFDKVWRLKNTGTCEWTENFALAFVSGERLGASTVQSLPNRVPPGGTVDVSVSMTAPSAPDEYTGYWRMTDVKGNDFGGKVSVQIRVGEATGAAVEPPIGADTTPAAALERPRTGTIIKAGSMADHGELNVENRSDSDIVLSLSSTPGQAFRSVYVRAGESFQLDFIPNGEYGIFYAAGSGWDNSTRGFTDESGLYRLDKTAAFTTKNGTYQHYDLTIESVEGNARRIPVSPSEFPE